MKTSLVDNNTPFSFSENPSPEDASINIDFGAQSLVEDYTEN